MNLSKQGSLLKDFEESLAPRVAETIVYWMVTFFSINWLRKNTDALRAWSLPLSVAIGRIIPGNEQFITQIIANIANRLEKVAKERVADWDSAKIKYGEFCQSPTKEVSDRDFTQFEKFLTFPNRDLILADLTKKFGQTGETIAAALKKINLSKLRGIKKIIPNLNVWDQKIAATKISKKLGSTTAKIQNKIPKLTGETKISRWLDEKRKNLEEKSNQRRK